MILSVTLAARDKCSKGNAQCKTNVRHYICMMLLRNHRRIMVHFMIMLTDITMKVSGNIGHAN